jgi:hypothetical protein
MDNRNGYHEVECEVCDFHPEFAKLLTTATTDLKWIRWTGYGILCVTGSFLLTIWSVLYPHILALNEQMQGLRVVSEINSRAIADLKSADVESKDDRKSLHAAIEQVWKGLK